MAEDEEMKILAGVFMVLVMLSVMGYILYLLWSIGKIIATL